MKLAIITGADGGMGTEITRAVAKAGYKIIMAFSGKGGEGEGNVGARYGQSAS